MLLSLYGGCSNDCPFCSGPFPADCTSGNLAESECLGHDIGNSCLGFSCDTEPRVGVSLPAILFCTEIDCNTIECSDDKIFADLSLDETGAFTATVIENGVNLGIARCLFFQN